MSPGEDEFDVLAVLEHRKNCTRRSACDRCRTHKLRCVKKASKGGPSEKCVRCQNANVRCHFSLQGNQGRPRRPRSSVSAPQADVISDCSAQAASRQTLSQAAQRLINGQHHPPGSRNGPHQQHGPASDYSERKEDGTSSWHQDLTALTSTALQASNNERNMEVDATFSHSPAFWGSLTSSMPTYDHHLFASSDGSVPRSFDDGNRERMDGVLALEHDTAEPGADDLVLALQRQQSGISLIGGGQQFSMQCTDNFLDYALPPATPEGGPSGGSGPQEATYESGTVLGHQKQQLAKLIMKLDCQAASYSNSVALRHCNAADTYPEDLAGAVLEGSFSFLDLLTTFKAPSSPSEPSTTAVLISHDHNIMNNIRSSTSPRAHRLHSPSTSTTPGNSTGGLTSRNAPSSHSPSHSLNQARPQLVDITTSLQILACYMHIIHLHSLLYTATHTYVTTHSRSAFASTSASTSSNSAPPRPLFPTLQVYGVPLTRPSTLKFHIQLLLQISLDTLGRIEAALGLPQGYGVRRGTGAAGEAETGASYGVLEASVSSQLVMVVMREEGAMGMERIREIRETVAVLRGELRGEIEI